MTSGISDPLIDPFGNQPICADFIGGSADKVAHGKGDQASSGDARAALGELEAAF
ncbi:hypothetical protein [Bradyrhizobium sp. Ash2021]|uniref:hypothetical protein n=1 Tax=Bradyrhizobium sp. Ash2021 TaxID=2954771 RepID=UPI0015C55C7C|nr:hypothetical protein [Bradyrhizobium sp. Ash2021]WMT78664.1 hypothetical protein NL528_21000 [Bradyrhizobium sp. Ash2021]